MLRGKDLNRTEADLTPFNTMEVLSESSFTSNPLDSARTTYTTGLNLNLKRLNLLGFKEGEIYFISKIYRIIFSS